MEGTMEKYLITQSLAHTPAFRPQKQSPEFEKSLIFLPPNYLHITRHIAYMYLSFFFFLSLKATCRTTSGSLLLAKLLVKQSAATAIRIRKSL